MSRLSQLICAVAVLSMSTVAFVADASASSSQSTFFESPGLFVNPATRPATIATLQQLGVRAIRVELAWHNVAPGADSARRPSFDPTDPAAYNWSEYDPVVEEAHERGWKVLLTVTSPVPKWATGNPHGKSLIYKPNANQFRSFMTAVGRHYAGLVSLYSIWNEPNHHEFLEPQFNTNGSPASPGIYRSLYTAGYKGLQAAGISHPSVLIGETAPEGEAHPRRPVRGPNHNLSPITFMRDVLCLSASYHRARGCPKLAATGWGLHPYASIRGPFYVPKNPETVTIGVLGRLTSALDRAARAGAIPSHLPLYITEFGVISTPNSQIGVPVAKQAEYQAIAEHIAYQNPRVASFSQYLLRDDTPKGRSHVAFQTGLEYASGKAKPLFSSFPVPLTVTRHGSGFALWGLVRPALDATTVTVEYRPRGSSRWRVLARPHTNALGYWSYSTHVAGSSWRVIWTSPEGEAFKGPPIRAY